MPQNSPVRSSVGVGFITSMNRPDAALALATLYGFQGRGDAKVGPVCVAGSGLDAAIFCDIVGRFYTVGPLPNANDVLPVGLAMASPMPADPPMVRAAVDRKDSNGQPFYARSIRRATDTSMAEAMLRNGVTLTRESAFVLSAPATHLARTLDLPGVKDLFAARVKRFVIVDAGDLQRDVPALRRVIEEWPTPIVFCANDIGDALRFPAASIGVAFSWADAHPVVDAYRAFRAMPYDAPSHDVAAVHYAAHAGSDGFQLSDPGTVTVGADGRLAFKPGAGGRVRALTVDPARASEIVREFVKVASARPRTG
jgi:hypothetical protein